MSITYVWLGRDAKGTFDFKNITVKGKEFTRSSVNFEMSYQRSPMTVNGENSEPYLEKLEDIPVNKIRFIDPLDKTAMNILLLATKYLDKQNIFEDTDVVADPDADAEAGDETGAEGNPDSSTNSTKVNSAADLEKQVQEIIFRGGETIYLKPDTATEGEEYQYDFNSVLEQHFSNYSNLIYRLQVDNPWPGDNAWLKIDSTEGILRGTPSAKNITQGLNVTVSFNSSGETLGSLTFWLQVKPNPGIPYLTYLRSQSHRLSIISKDRSYASYSDVTDRVGKFITINDGIWDDGLYTITNFDYLNHTINNKTDSPDVRLDRNTFSLNSLNDKTIYKIKPTKLETGTKSWKKIFSKIDNIPIKDGYLVLDCGVLTNKRKDELGVKNISIWLKPKEVNVSEDCNIYPSEALPSSESGFTGSHKLVKDEEVYHQAYKIPKPNLSGTNEYLDAFAYDDILWGTAHDNSLYGSGGYNILWGAGGEDMLKTAFKKITKLGPEKNNTTTYRSDDTYCYNAEYVAISNENEKDDSIIDVSGFLADDRVTATIEPLKIVLFNENFKDDQVSRDLRIGEFACAKNSDGKYSLTWGDSPIFNFTPKGDENTIFEGFKLHHAKSCDFGGVQKMEHFTDVSCVFSN